MTNEAFLGLAINDLIGNKISVNLSNKKRVSNGIDGFFDYQSRQLQVATQHDMFIEIFIHEYCHFLQFKQDEEKYKALCDGVFFQWLSGNIYNLPKKKLLTSMVNCIILEHDCDKKALRLIEEYKLNIDKEQYIQFSGAYLLSHWFSLEFRARPDYLIYVADKLPKNKLRNISYYLNEKNYFKFRDLFLIK